MTRSPLISVEDACSLIARHARLMDAESTPLTQAAGRRLAAPLIAAVTQPPLAVSAMDGYAIRHGDLADGPAFRLIGEAPAGAPFGGAVSRGECVRIFTGSVMPAGADHVVIQEDVETNGQIVTVTDAQPDAPRNVRAAGIDFSTGDELLPTGTRLVGASLAVAAAANHDRLTTYRRPRVGIIANGDELRLPGSTMEPGEIVCSTPYGLADLIAHWGGDPIFHGIATDTLTSIKAAISSLATADIIVPLGGASVGDHDHMKAAFGEMGHRLVFSKVAVKPGKPTWFSQLGRQLVLGLPGNPASGLVCAHIFLRRLIEGMTGAPSPGGRWIRARLTTAMRPEGNRDNFQRATLEFGPDAVARVTPASAQDSSLLSPFTTANVLVFRKAGSPEAAIDDLADCLVLSPMSGHETVDNAF